MHSNSLIKKLARNSKSLMMFLTVGGLTSILYISFFAFLYKLLSVNYQIAISISYLFSVTFYFFANRSFTFKNSNNTMKQQLPRYLIMLLINYLITLAIMHMTVEIFKLPPYLGIVAAIGFTFMLSYTLSRFWIFIAD